MRQGEFIMTRASIKDRNSETQGGYSKYYALKG
jgi:hypothetical protein